MIRNFLGAFFVLFLLFSSHSSFAEDNTVKVICNILEYIWSFGGPLMTMVIIGSAILAIFGKMQWAALVALAVFTGVFFGAPNIVKFMINNVKEDGKTVHLCGKVDTTGSTKNANANQK
jgi:type IV secretory pathway VirB2 component (pilin)